MAIYLTQWLCPSQHALIASVWDEDYSTAAEVEQLGERNFERFVERRCAMCNSTEIRVEHTATSHQDMRSANAAALQIAIAYAEARSLVERTQENRRN